MARLWDKNLTAAIRAPFRKRFLSADAANTTNALKVSTSWANDNAYESRWRNAADTDDVRVVTVDANNVIQVAEEAVVPLRKTVRFAVQPSAQIATNQCFFIARTACRIVGITEIHATAESTASTLTGYVEKLTSTTAPGSGTTVMSGTFNLKATANTLQTATLTTSGTGDSDAADLQLAAGDRLSFVVSAAVTELAGICVEVAIAPAGTDSIVVTTLPLATDCVDQHLFVANRDYIVTGISYVHKTQASSGTVNLQIAKTTSTQAPASGTNLLTNNTNAGFDCRGTNNTVQTGTLTATAASLRLAPGDRLSADFTGTVTGLVDVVIVIVLQAVERRREVTFCVSNNSYLDTNSDAVFFTADRNYEITAISEVHATAAGGVSKFQVTRDKATDAPGAGTDLLSNNTNAGFDLNGTANTVQLGTFVDTRFNFLMAGDRLSVDFANAKQSTAGVVVTVSLKPA